MSREEDAWVLDAAVVAESVGRSAAQGIMPSIRPRAVLMSDKLVEVAAFSLPIEASAARGLLEAEGIKAVLCGEQVVGVLGIQGLGGKVTLHVAESDADRALG